MEVVINACAVWIRGTMALADIDVNLLKVCPTGLGVALLLRQFFVGL